MTTALSLYEISNELAELLDTGIDDDGVISDDLAIALYKFEDKSKAVTAYILNQISTADAVDETIKRLEKRAISFRNRAESLKTYLRESMRRTGIMEIVAADGTFTAKLHIERDARVDVFNQAQVPSAYRLPAKPSIPAPDKDAIAQAFKSGKEVPGCRIVKSDRLEIR